MASFILAMSIYLSFCLNSMNLSKRLWTAFKLGILSIFNVSRRDYEEILYTRNDDSKALKSDWQKIIGDYNEK